MCVFIVCASSTQFPKIKFVAFAVAVHLPACASHVLIKCSATQGYAASDQEMTLDDSVIELRRASACFFKNRYKPQHRSFVSSQPCFESSRCHLLAGQRMSTALMLELRSDKP